MNQLINITEQDGKQAVSARELHEFLGSKREFATWIKDRIKKYDLVEDQDYVCLTSSSSEGRGGQNKIEYALTLDCAKELSMVEGNAKGKEARRYFIACEKKMKASVLEIPQTYAEALLLASQQAKRIELQSKELKQVAPKVEYYDNVLQSTSTYTTTQIAKDLGIRSCILLNAKLKSLGIIFMQSGTWMLTAKYASKGYAKTRTYAFTGSTGEEKTNMSLVWTEEGREFLRSLNLTNDVMKSKKLINA